MRLIITDEEFDNQPEPLDHRKSTPADVGDALAGLIDDHKVESCVLIAQDRDGTLRILMTDMTNTELVGTLEVAKSNYLHIAQHSKEWEDD